MIPSRDEAFALLTEHTQSPNLIKHGLAVEAAMRHYAVRLGGSVELWGVVGLLHDLDYEQHPSLEEHPFVGAEILRSAGFDEELVRAVLSHAGHTGVERTTLMERALYAVDELVGFVVAVALIRPGRNLLELPVSSVTKKLKDKAFCRAIDRDHLRGGAEEIGLPLRQHVEHVIESLQGIAPELGLDGDATAP